MGKKNSMLAGPSQADADQYQGEDDLRTLSRAEEVRSDPKRMKRVVGVHRNQLAALTKTGRSLGAMATGASLKRRLRGKRR